MFHFKQAQVQCIFNGTLKYFRLYITFKDAVTPPFSRGKREHKFLAKMLKSEKDKIKQLEEENMYLKAENEYLKKLRALVQERELKEKKK